MLLPDQQLFSQPNCIDLLIALNPCDTVHQIFHSIKQAFKRIMIARS